jgi:hypothetical protein
MDKYILKNGKPVLEPDLKTWAAWFEHADRLIKLTYVSDEVEVSTVFLGLDHAFSPATDRLPVLWETLIFGGPLDGQQRRFTDKKSALEHHAAVVFNLREGIKINKQLQKVIDRTLRNSERQVRREKREKKQRDRWNGAPLIPEKGG